MSSDKSACLSENEALEKLRTEIRYRHYSIRTERTYEQWVARFLIFCKSVSLEDLSRKEARQFLDHLAVDRGVSAGTQNQAFL